MALEIATTTAIVPAGATETITLSLTALLRFATVYWSAFSWTIIELGLGAGGADDLGIWALLATEPALNLSLDESGRQSLRVGMGVGIGAVVFVDDSRNDGGGAGLTISPVVRYAYQVVEPVFVGAGIRAILPLTSTAETRHSVAAITAFIDVSWSLQ